MGDVGPQLMHGPSESITQMASRSVQPFFHSSRQKVLILYNGPPFPQNCPFPWGIWTTVQYMIPWAHPSPQPKRHLDRFSRFCTVHHSVPILYNGLPLPSKLPLSTEGSRPHLIHGSLGPPESSTQMVEPLLQGSLL